MLIQTLKILQNTLSEKRSFSSFVLSNFVWSVFSAVLAFAKCVAGFWDIDHFGSVVGKGLCQVCIVRCGVRDGKPTLLNVALRIKCGHHQISSTSSTYIPQLLYSALY